MILPEASILCLGKIVKKLVYYFYGTVYTLISVTFDAQGLMSGNDHNRNPCLYFL